MNVALDIMSCCVYPVFFLSFLKFLNMLFFKNTKIYLNYYLITHNSNFLKIFFATTTSHDKSEKQYGGGDVVGSVPHLTEKFKLFS